MIQLNMHDYGIHSKDVLRELDKFELHYFNRE